MWANEEEFLYYLKSYNWRSRQENIVNSKFLLQKNKEEICSYSYMACIYVEHMKLRLSEINDIPYPDNLYMLMEALEGYSKIYEHSKYFIVEENQICVDDFGNVKVWVNGDLSINYPSIIVEDNQRMGQEEMVDAIINMIADNTDYETEPKPSFRYRACHLGSTTTRRRRGRRGRSSMRPATSSSATRGTCSNSLDSTISKYHHGSKPSSTSLTTISTSKRSPSRAWIRATRATRAAVCSSHLLPPTPTSPAKRSTSTLSLWA
jgi:hypothetical protein